MKVTDAVRLCLWYVKDFILFSVSTDYVANREGEGHKVGVWNDFSHLTLPEGCDGIDGEVSRHDEKFIWSLK